MAETDKDPYGSDLDDVLDGGSNDSDDEGGQQDAVGESDDSSGTSGGDSNEVTVEAFRKMQSERDKAIAEANRLKKQSNSTEGEPPKEDAPESSPDPWVKASKKQYRDQLYESVPALKEYGVDPSLISGRTPAEMDQSFQNLLGTMGKLTNNIRSQVLNQHGLDPAPAPGGRGQPLNYSTMSKEEFDKVVEGALTD